MNNNNLIAEVLDFEWKMLQQMEGQGNSSEDRMMFDIMRRAQFDAWPQDVTASYLLDLKAAEAAGRNLQHEKFARMLINIAPEEYAAELVKIPAIPEENRSLVASTWEILKKLTQEFAERHPMLGLSGRPLLAKAESEVPSIETYQTAEMMTYSLNTLQLFHNFVKTDAEAGNSIVFAVQQNTVKAMGFSSLDEAEKQMALEALSQFEISSCPTCGMSPMD